MSMKRLREYGFQPGLLPPGALNKISDVAGVAVGHLTRIEGDDIRTGVTLIDPGVKNLYHNKLPAAVAVGNGYGKMTGIAQINELGTLETPIALTNTLAVGPAAQGLVELMLRITKNMPAGTTVNAVAAETSDAIVNNIHRIVIAPADVAAAYERRERDFALGSVGAGTGTSAFGWKGGIGSASRVALAAGREYTVGALLQTNYGGALTIMGVPIGQLLGGTDFDKFIPPCKATAGRSKGAAAASSRIIAANTSPRQDGSCMMILATDAPLSARQLGRVARRAVLGLGRTGSVLGNGSGDFAIAFSTSRAGVEGAKGAGGAGNFGKCLPDAELNSLFLAAIEAVEESVYDSLFMSETVTGHGGRTLEQIPVAKVVKLLKKYVPRISRP